MRFEHATQLRFTSLLLAAAGLLPLTTSGAERFAMAQAVQGSAARIAPGAPPAPLKPGTLLAPGDRLQVAAAAQVTLLFFANLKRRDVSGIDADLASLASDVSPLGAPTSGSPEMKSLVAVLSVPQLEPLGVTRVDVPETVRGRQRGLVSLEYPRNTSIRESLPLFRWKPVDGADGYEITILSGTLETIVDRARVATPQFRYRPDLPALLPDRPYFWQVRSVGIARRPGPLVYFRLLGADSSRDAANLVSSARALSTGLPDDTASLLVGSALHAAGLDGEAFALLQPAVDRNPDHEALGEACHTVRTAMGLARR